MPVDVNALFVAFFSFLGIAVTGMLGYMSVRTQQIHKLANSNLSEQTKLVAEAQAEISSMRREHAAELKGLSSMIAELNRKIPSTEFVTVPDKRGEAEPAPTGAEDDPMQIEIVAQTKPVEVEMVKPDKKS